MFPHGTTPIDPNTTDHKQVRQALEDLASRLADEQDGAIGSNALRCAGGASDDWLRN